MVLVLRFVPDCAEEPLAVHEVIDVHDAHLQASGKLDGRDGHDGDSSCVSHIVHGLRNEYEFKALSRLLGLSKQYFKQ